MKSSPFFFFLLIFIISISNCDSPDSNVPDKPTELELIEKYKDVTLIDAHSHHADIYPIIKNTWDYYGIDKTILFGSISEPDAQRTDSLAWKAYVEYPDLVIPFIAGINIHDSSCLDYIKANFEKGVAGIGEVVGASLYSPVVSNVAWKGEHPMDKLFPAVYQLCGKYNKPILIHIDPPSGIAITKFEEAAETFPNTTFIFAHGNAYNTPENVRSLLEKHPNIYIDFFPGFNYFNPERQLSINDWIPLINEFPDRFVVSTDSGYAIGYDNAVIAIYRLFELLDENIVEKIAHKNTERVLGID